MSTSTVPRTAKATEAFARYAAERAADDPAKVRRALRVVTAAAARGLLAPEALDAARRAAEAAPPLPDGARSILTTTGLAAGTQPDEAA